MQQRTVQYLSISFFVCLVLWGIYTLLYYIGVPVHVAVLMHGESASRLGEFCGDGELACRGLFGFFDAMSRSLGRMRPLLSYGVVSLVAYIGFLFVQGVRTGRFALNFRLRPWHVYGAFVLAITLIFTSLAFGDVETNTTSGTRMIPVRMLIEPSPQVYRSMDQQSLQVLQNNFSRLQDAGCLRSAGEFTSGASQYLIKSSCLYGSFIKIALSQVLFISLLLCTLLITGSTILRRLKFQPDRVFTDVVVSTVLGACIWVVLLWTMAVFSILTKQAAWFAALLILALGYRQIVYWWKQFTRNSVAVSLPWYHVSVLLFWLLVSYLALNFLNVVRPFPIGWDDLGSYLNRPRLMVSYGEFIFSMSPFQWEYLTSLGFLLFGYNSTFGATASMLINWMAGLLAVLSIILFGRTFIGRGRGLLAATLYYLLPLVGHFSFADMKIDNGVFAVGAVSMYCMFRFLFKPEEEEAETSDSWKPVWPWLLLAGVLAGFAFNMKQTAIMIIMTNLAIMLGVLLHWVAFLGVVLLAGMAFAFQGILDINRIIERLTGAGGAFSQQQFLLILCVLGLLIIGAAVYLARKRFQLAGRSAGFFLLAVALPVIPWIWHNNIERGNYFPPRLEFGAPNTISPTLDLTGKRANETSAVENIVSLPPELTVDPNNAACEPTGNVEELDRYWGFRHGWTHYLTLPWRTVNNIDSGGYYVTTTPALLLFPLLLLLPFFWRRQAAWLRWLFAGTVFILVQWVLLANGIPWYGIGVFLGLVIGLEMMCARAPDMPAKAVFGLLATCWILLMLNNRFWQFEMQRNLFEYPMGKVDYATLKERTIPHYDDIADIVLARHESEPDRPYLYRVGTFIPYFIPKNLEVIGLADHQLDMFNCLYQERDPALTTQRLKALGFNSIVFDTNTHTIERDPNGSLHKKVNLFTEYLNNPESGVQVIMSDTSAGVAFILIP